VASYYKRTYLRNDEGRSIDEDLIEGAKYLDDVKLTAATRQMLTKANNFDD
jgi:hypothetical protein